MTGRTLHGLGVAGGVAMGVAAVIDDRAVRGAVGRGGPREAERALGALTRVAEQLERWEETARQEGRREEAEILAASRLLATDPLFLEDVAARAGVVSADAAVEEVADRHARALERLDNPELAARGADVRELGRRVVRLLSGRETLRLPAQPSVVLARDLGPADVAELSLPEGRVLGLALADGAATSHAAIMVRACGVPLVVGLGESLLGDTAGRTVFLDGFEGVVVVEPDADIRRRGEQSARERVELGRRLRAGRRVPAATRDGRSVRLLCNASTAEEVAAGAEARAEGVGLVRTELAFLEAADWPAESEHAAVLTPLLAPLAGRIATVRTLDFGRDKTPPFLRDRTEGRHGLALTLTRPDALAAQLRAIVAAGARTHLRVLLPFVRTPDEVDATRQLLQRAVAEAGRPLPEALLLGAMVESPEAVAVAEALAARTDFLSIGTNDLVQTTLGLDRDLPLAAVASAAHPRVLALVRQTVEAAHARGIPVEVCGEAAGEPTVAALLLGLGVDELSVMPGRLDVTRWAIGAVSASDAAAAAGSALSAGSQEEALEVGRALLGPAAEVELASQLREPSSSGTVA